MPDIIIFVIAVGKDLFPVFILLLTEIVDVGIPLPAIDLNYKKELRNFAYAPFPGPMITFTKRPKAF